VMPPAPLTLQAAAVAARTGRPRLERLGRALRTLALDEPERFVSLRSFVGEDEVETLYAGELQRERRAGNALQAWMADLYRSGHGTALRRMRLVDVSTYLADCLLPKVDVATMAHGLEARSPLLDQEVLEFALGLPDHWLVDGNGGKPLLKRLLGRFLPARLFQRPKQGFSVPLQVWFGCGPSSEWANDLAESDSLRASGWFKTDGIRHLVRQHQQGDRDHSQRLFNLMVLREWLNQH